MDPVVVWLALAVLGGVVGNLSYDLIKVGLRRIVRRHRRTEVISRGSVDLDSGNIVIGPRVELQITWTAAELRECDALLREYFVARLAKLPRAANVMAQHRVGVAAGSGRASVQRTSTALRRLTSGCTRRPRGKKRGRG